MPAVQVNIETTAVSEQVILETQNALAMTTPNNENPPVEIVRDGTGRPTALIIQFPDDIEASSKAAAIEKIQRNSGVATVVTEPPVVLSENFDAFAAGILSDEDTRAAGARHITAAGLRLIANGLGGVGTRIPTNEIDAVLSNSAPNSAKQKLVASGTTSNFRFAAVGQLDTLPGQGLAISTFRYRFAIRLPTDFLDKDPAGQLMVVEVRFGRLLKNTSGGRSSFILRFEADSDPVSPGTQLVGSLFLPAATGGTVANLILPLDNAWHTIDILRVANVGADVAWTVSVDATSETFVFPGQVSMVVPTFFTSQSQTFGVFNAPFTVEQGLDDIEVAYKLA